MRDGLSSWLKVPLRIDQRGAASWLVRTRTPEGYEAIPRAEKKL